MASPQTNPRFGSATAYDLAWTSTPADYDILENGPGYSGANGVGVMSAAIRCNTGGTLVVTDIEGDDQTLYFADGETRYVQAQALVASGSTALYVEVMW